MDQRLQSSLDSVGASVAGILPLELSPRICGVYFLLRWGKIVYIGQSIDVVARVRSHYDERIFGFDSAVYLPVDEWKLNQVEQTLIYQLRPEYNRQILVPSSTFEPWIEDRQIADLAVAAVYGRGDGITHNELIRLVWKELNYHVGSRVLTRILEAEKRIRWHNSLAVYVPAGSDAVQPQG